MKEFKTISLDEFINLYKNGNIKSKSMYLNETEDSHFKVPCRLIKPSDPPDIRGADMWPIMHKNTLGQILYETFPSTTLHSNHLISPIVVILSDTAVQGLDAPGLYVLDSHLNQYTSIREFVQGDDISSRFRKIKQSNDINSNLAIGHSINLHKLITNKNYDMFVNEIDNLTIQIKQMLKIHGSIEDKSIDTLNLKEPSKVLTYNGFLIYPMYRLQWLIKEASPLSNV